MQGGDLTDPEMLIGRVKWFNHQRDLVKSGLAIVMEEMTAVSDDRKWGAYNLARHDTLTEVQRGRVKLTDKPLSDTVLKSVSSKAVWTAELHINFCMGRLIHGNNFESMLNDSKFALSLSVFSLQEPEEKALKDDQISQKLLGHEL
ncbi:hypothetical protein A2U01_0006654 [Trifolium medium]|uniref:Uncharacterized protein n=1 Tax=Trifolium medium TaxID=97028 RepID=A0A392MF48_9FABA|nr:hypothetical protein [Trifolium medium]